VCVCVCVISFAFLKMFHSAD